MKYGAQLRDYRELELAAAIDKARSHGCDGFEMGYSAGGIRTGKTTANELLDRAGKDGELFARMDFEALSFTSGLFPKHAELPELVEAACQVANAVGTRQIRMFVSPYVRLGGPGSTLDDFTQQYDGSSTYDEWYERDSKHLPVFVELAKKYDVRFVFELHHGFSATSPSAYRRLLSPYSSRYVGTIFDPGNMVIEGNEGWRTSVEILGEYIGYVHCKNQRWDQHDDGNWVPSCDSLDNGLADYPMIVTALKDIGFDGYLCIEDLRKGLTSEEKVRDPVAYLKRLEASDDRVLPT